MPTLSWTGLPTPYVAHSHGPFRTKGYEVQIAAEFLKETNDRCKTLLLLRPQLCQLDVKYGLFELTQMWITKNGKSKEFYDPEDLRLSLESLSCPDHGHDLLGPALGTDQ
ncbi:hypothetical protein NDU88_004409 [Pleurodeles waltl]|uniref:Uncharacterized protein n=1 Tax=Pleurodeles waltl TaxID=8319 RepID=A0AAV7NJP8_PLEWA|nr:hypothetical protein NDU88_004409 [Pleurodeles waltl]